MKKPFLKKLIPIVLLVVAVVAVVELQKFMKSQCGECTDGICEAPAGSGLVINPFPPEQEDLTIQTPQPTPAYGHPSEGGELLKSPPSEGCRNGGVGLSTYHGTTSQSLSALPPAQAAEQPRPQLIDFGAGKCATCKTMNVVLEELSAEHGDQIDVRFVDVWKNEEMGKEYSIRMIPTQVFLDADGNELFRNEGFISKEDILKKWAELGINFVSNE